MDIERQRLSPHFVERLRQALVDASAGVGLAYSCFRTIDPAGNLKAYDDSPHFERFRANRKRTSSTPASSACRSCTRKHTRSSSAAIEWSPSRISIIGCGSPKYATSVMYLTSSWIIARTLRSASRNRSIHRVSATGTGVDKFNLARQEARIRRGIANETTIIVPVRRGTERTVENLERLLEQPWSDYLVWIVDLGHEAFARVRPERDRGSADILVRALGRRRDGRLFAGSCATWRRLLHCYLAMVRSPSSVDPSEARNRRWWSDPFGQVFRTEGLRARLTMRRVILAAPLLLVYRLYRFIGARIFARVRSLKSRLSHMKSRLSRAWRFTFYERGRSSKRQAIFQKIYEDNLLGQRTFPQRLRLDVGIDRASARILTAIRGEDSGQIAARHTMWRFSMDEKRIARRRILWSRHRPSVD